MHTRVKRVNGVDHVMHAYYVGLQGSMVSGMCILGFERVKVVNNVNLRVHRVENVRMYILGLKELKGLGRSNEPLQKHKNTRFSMVARNFKFYFNLLIEILLNYILKCAFEFPKKNRNS